MPRSGVAGSYGNSSLSFFEAPQHRCHWLPWNLVYNACQVTEQTLLRSAFIYKALSLEVDASSPGRRKSWQVLRTLPELSTSVHPQASLISHCRIQEEFWWSLWAFSHLSSVLVSLSWDCLPPSTPEAPLRGRKRGFCLSLCGSSLLGRKDVYTAERRPHETLIWRRWSSWVQDLWRLA